MPAGDGFRGHDCDTPLLPPRSQQAPVGRDVPAVLPRPGPVQLWRRDSQTVGPEDGSLAAGRGGAAEPWLRSGSECSHLVPFGFQTWPPRTGRDLSVVSLNLSSFPRLSTGGVVWRIRASDTRLVCAAGSRNGTEETKLLVLDFDLDDMEKDADWVMSSDGDNSMFPKGNLFCLLFFIIVDQRLVAYNWIIMWLREASKTSALKMTAGPSLVQGWSRLVQASPGWSKVGPGWSWLVQVGPGWSKVCPCRSRLVQGWSKDGQSWSMLVQAGPRLAQDRSKVYPGWTSLDRRLCVECKDQCCWRNSLDGWMLGLNSCCSTNDELAPKVAPEHPNSEVHEHSVDCGVADRQKCEVGVVGQEIDDHRSQHCSDLLHFVTSKVSKSIILLIKRPVLHGKLHSLQHTRLLTVKSNLLTWETCLPEWSGICCLIKWIV